MTPQTIGRYRIISTLGEGGMGTVYQAEQDQPHRMVALKVIRPGLVSPELTRRFERESEALGRLQHPGIAQIYEAGSAEGPFGVQSFFAMELVRGQPLTDYADSRKLDIPQRLELFGRICDAVHYAHQHGVIHRDLKPANIMVDSTGQPKVLDFGVARLTDIDVQASRQTSVGEVIGTLQYMSPEQVNADPTAIDIRSDVYTLGVILYELLTSRRPYDLARKMIHEAAKVILIDEPSRLSAIDRRLAGDVEIIVAKALEKEKVRRYDSADDLASDIRRYLRDEPIVARPASTMYQIRKFARRNRPLVTGVVAAASILVIGTAVSLWLAIRATAAERLAESRRQEAVGASELAERRRAVADSASLVADSARAAAQRDQAAATASAKQAIDEAAKARAVTGFLERMLSSSDPSNARGKDLSVRDVLDQAAADVGNDELVREPEVRAAVEATIGRTYFGLGLYDQARTHLDSAYAIRGRTLGRGSVLYAQSADESGKLARAAGDYRLAGARMAEALRIMEASLPPDDDRVTSLLEAYADVRYGDGKFAEAEALYRKALRLTRSRHGNEGVAVATRLKALGSFLSYTSRPTEAKPLLEESIRTFRRAHGADHPQIIDGLVGLSDAEADIPDYGAAEKALREALPIAHRVYPKGHPAVANVISRLGTMVASQGRVEEGEPLLRESLAMRIRLLGENHPDVQLDRTSLARAIQSRSRFPEADSLLSQALKARRATLGDSSPAVAASLSDLGYLAQLREEWGAAADRFRESIPIWRNAKIEDQELASQAGLAWSLQRQGKNDEAEPILLQVLARRRAVFGDDHWSVGDTYEKLAAVAIDRGNIARAESLTVSGLEVRRKVYGPKSPQVAGQLMNVAFIKERRGDSAGAIPHLRETVAIYTPLIPPGDPTLAGARRMLAIDLCATGAVAEGDSIARATIAVVRVDTTQSLIYRLRSALGFCLTRASRFTEAEPLLLEAELRLGAQSATTAVRSRAQVVGWLASLYDRWGKPAEAAAWSARKDLKP